MLLKMTFLGTGSAFTIGDGNYQSNVLLQLQDDSLLIDAGTDLRFSLAEQNLDFKIINNIYISHLHADHVGGLEWLALSHYFATDVKKKPVLFASDQLIGDLWKKSLAGGLETLTAKKASLDMYFDVCPIKGNGYFRWQDINFRIVQTVHVYNNLKLQPCFGLMFEHNSTRIFYSADTQYSPHQLQDFYSEADIIFHDCETSAIKSGVHAHYSELRKIPIEFRKKMWLYHYSPGPLPDARADGFPGFVRKGQCFEF